MKKHITSIILIAVFLIGLSLLLYPTFSNYWNSLRNSKAVASYVEEVSSLEEDEYDKIWQEALQYNADLAQSTQHFILNEEELSRYSATLDVLGTGIMGYVEIPSIQVSLPIYHSANDAVLQKAVGHLEWSSLPTGGQDTHCVISGHRGLPSAKLFTDLDQLVEGDTFALCVLDEVLTYEVCEILTVNPDEVQDLMIQKGEDLCTLVTCTPYGINTHRLLITGKRVETPEEHEAIRVTSDALRIEPIVVAPLVATVMLMVLMVVLFVRSKFKKNEVTK